MMGGYIIIIEPTPYCHNPDERWQVRQVYAGKRLRVCTGRHKVCVRVHVCLRVCIITCICVLWVMRKSVYGGMSMCVLAAEEISSSCKLNPAPSLDSPCWASSASYACFGTRSWLVCRSGWYSGWSPGGAPETDTCWTKTPSPVPASGALCRDTASSFHSWLLTSCPLSFPRMHHLGQ